MAKTAAVRFKDRIASELMLRVAALMRGSRAGFVHGPDRIVVDDPELELFMDWDVLRGDGRGAYTHDDTECRSRRVDLRGPTDEDPGPLPMEEPPDDITGRFLFLSQPTS